MSPLEAAVTVNWHLVSYFGDCSSNTDNFVPFLEESPSNAWMRFGYQYAATNLGIFTTNTCGDIRFKVSNPQ